MPQVVNLEKYFTTAENLRADGCSEKIKKILEEDQCVILPVHYLASDGRIATEVHIAPRRVIQVPQLALPESILPNPRPIIVG